MRRIRAQEAIIITVILIILIIVSIFTSSRHLKDSPLPQAHVATSTPIKLVSFTNSYSHRKYTFNGKVAVPTVCYVVSATSAVIASTTPQLIRIDLNVPSDNGRCLQLPATATFSVTQKSVKNAVVRVYLNGTLATSTPL